MEPLTLKNLPTQSAFNLEKPAKAAPRFIPFSQAFASRGLENSQPEEASYAPVNHEDKKVNYIEEQGVIKKIKITCSCGEVTILDCVYAHI